MKTSASNKYNELIDIFHARLGWNKARVKFFLSFICSLCKEQTVCFVKTTQEFEGKAKIESNHRRIQRFFAQFIVDTNLIAKLIFSLLPEKPPYRLCIEGTNWKYDKADFNILMISIAYQGVAIPIMWTMLPKRGNSNTTERKALIHWFIDLFGRIFLAHALLNPLSFKYLIKRIQILSCTWIFLTFENKKLFSPIEN